MPAAAVRPDPLRAAADWYVRLGDGQPSPADQAAWQAWYDQAAEHRDAWQRVERLKDLLGQAPQRSAQALERLGRSRLATRRGVLAGLGVVGVASAAYQLLPWLAPTPVDWIATAAGEQRELRLPDGSELLLAPQSRVGIAYGRRERVLHLAQGGLQLRTAIDALDRPLRVLGRDGSIRPLGTRFIVVQTARDTLVAVQAHAVEVLPIQSKFPVRVLAGQRLRFTAALAGAPVIVDGSEDAWTRGVLLAMEQPLAEFLQALQVQSGVALSCDPAIAGLRVSGSFLARDPRRSLATLAEQHRLRLEPRGSAWHLTAR